MAAAFFAAPEWELTDSEAKTLSAALAEFERHHSVPMLDEKRRSEVMLAFALGAVYLPRARETYLRIRRGKKPARQPASFNVPPAAETAQQSGATFDGIMPDFLTRANNGPVN